MPTRKPAPATVGKHKYVIGIDPGTITGFAIWNTEEKRFTCVDSDKLHDCFMRIENCIENNMDFMVRVEDARKRTWFGNTGKERLKGAGSVERDCSIWDDFLNDLGVDYEMVHPKANRTKMTAAAFRQLTGWAKATNEHGRDAAALCFGHSGTFYQDKLKQMK